ncbi:MarR family transcriptional regulator [Leptolyngbya boryana CZ1]|uniref:MarR family transcriptional regulator n=2 Tax=Leptolyngbya TaxID=47251 RepID=A0AA97AR26_LEPBY|nr:MarR family transcriptional regulator [Leptolyngbya boryana]WNZ48173.1 MarR family transcriptional regulator [Leptolyngbya boryana CZ1]
MISSQVEPIPMHLKCLLAPHGIGYRIKLLSQLANRKFQERLDPFKLTPFHWIVLCCLWQEDGQATSSIGDRLQQVGGTLTGVLDRMGERGLIRRERDAQDRRIWRIWLTDAGRKFEEILPPLATELRDAALQGISIPNREQLSTIVDRMIANLGESPIIHPAEGWEAIFAPNNLGYRMKLIAQLGTRRFQDLLEPFGLTPFHWVVLCCLWQEDGQATSSIGENLQQVGGTLTGVLDRMSERGLIRRERDAQDRRIWRIWLTDAGLELRQTLPMAALELLQMMMQDISEDEQTLLSKCVDRLIANLAEV